MVITIEIIVVHIKVRIQTSKRSKLLNHFLKINFLAFNRMAIFEYLFDCQLSTQFTRLCCNLPDTQFIQWLTKHIYNATIGFGR